MGEAYWGGGLETPTAGWCLTNSYSSGGKCQMDS